MAAVVHIGPPKTATKSLQAALIPLLGRPYVIKPAWGKDLAKRSGAVDPGALPRDVIVSDEGFGDFKVYPPETIADRLAVLFAGAIVIYVRREPVEWFYSIYRERLITWASIAAKFFSGNIATGLGTPDEFFDHQLYLHTTHGVGVFAAMDEARVAAAFNRHFQFRVIDFALLQHAPRAFALAFADACGGIAAPLLPESLPRLNAFSPSRVDDVASALPASAVGDVRQTISFLYESARVSPEREQHLRKLSGASA